jgi:hypothetical protein
MATKIQLRRGTASQWTSANPTLSSGEVGFETDTGKFKIGNGSTSWSSLSYAASTPTEITNQVNLAVSNLIDSAPGTLDTLNELAAAINDDPSFFTTIATNLSNHESDTTNVHGISNTANLVYTNDSRLSDSRTPTSHAASHGSAGGDAITISQSQVTDLTTDLSAKAPLTSPTFTGTPAAPTASAGTNTTQIATTAFVRTEVSNIVASAPSTLDTLDELAAALGDDANFATTVTTSIASKAPIASPTFTGTVTIPNLNVTGTLDAQEIREAINDITLSSNVGTFDWSTGNVFFIGTAPTANMTFNFTNVPTENGEIMSITVFVTQGATGRIPSTLNINGSAATIRWVNGTNPVPTSTAGKIDIFAFSLIRRADSWTVLGSSSLNF